MATIGRIRTVIIIAAIILGTVAVWSACSGPFAGTLCSGQGTPATGSMSPSGLPDGSLQQAPGDAETPGLQKGLPPGERNAAVTIALNDSRVREHLTGGYEITGTGPVCSPRDPGNGREREHCFTGVRFRTGDRFVTAYVDMEKRLVNHTATQYLRDPAIAPTTDAPR